MVGAMTNEQLDELERLEKAATAGPWCTHPNGTSLWQGAGWTGDQLGSRQRHVCNATGVTEQHVADLELLCEMRNALPDLIAAARELAELEKQVAEVREYASEMQSAASSDGPWEDWGEVLNMLHVPGRERGT